MLHKEKLAQLYNSGKSMMEISKIIGCSDGEVRYWMNKFGIKRRNYSEATYIKQNPNGDPFKIKTTLNINESFLQGLGLGIYWGEGNKKGKSLKISNTDPALIRTFRQFLRIICNVEEAKIRYSIVCFNDTDPHEAKKYWSKELQISPEKFGKITQIPTQGKGTYKRKSFYGVCSLNVSNIKLKDWVLSRIEAT